MKWNLKKTLKMKITKNKTSNLVSVVEGLTLLNIFATVTWIVTSSMRNKRRCLASTAAIPHSWEAISPYRTQLIEITEFL